MILYIYISFRFPATRIVPLYGLAVTNKNGIAYSAFIRYFLIIGNTHGSVMDSRVIFKLYKGFMNRVEYKYKFLK